MAHLGFLSVGNAEINSFLRNKSAKEGQYYLAASGEMFLGSRSKRVRITDTAKTTVYFNADGSIISVQEVLDGLISQIPAFDFITATTNTADINLSVTSQTLSALLTATGVVPATYGDAANTGQFTVDAKGRITAASNVAIAFPVDFITSVSDTNTIDLNVAAGVLTANVIDNTNIQRLNFLKAGVLTGVRWRENYIDGTSISISLVDNRAQDRIDTTISVVGLVIGTDVQKWDADLDQVATVANIRGDILVTDSTPNWVRLALGSSGKILQSDGNDLVYTPFTLPTSMPSSGKFLISNGTNFVATTSTIPENAGVTSGKMLVSDGTNYVLSTPTFPNASASSGKIIISDGTNWIASTPTYPNTSGSAGKILRSDGTNNVYTTATFSGTYAASNLLYSNGANTVTGLATANSSILVTSGAGVPSFSTTIPNGITATTQPANDNSTKLATTAYVDGTYRVMRVFTYQQFI